MQFMGTLGLTKVPQLHSQKLKEKKRLRKNDKKVKQLDGFL